MKSLPLIYYPTTVCWVDDDSLLLETFTICFEDKLTIQAENHPKIALEKLCQHHDLLQPENLLRSCVDHEDYDLSDHLPVDINFSAIDDIRNNPERYHDIAVLIVDYNMPEMDGITLCHQLKSLPAKKILLTGERDPQKAITAFNDGIIDRFICKGEADLDDILLTHINTLTQDYFIQQTAALRHHIEADKKLPQSDPVFCEIFDEIAIKHHITAYFLADKNGGMILINSQQDTFYLVVHTKATLDQFVSLHEGNAETQSLVAAVTKRESIPFFGKGKEAWDVDPEEWPQHFYAPLQSQNNATYYCAVVKISL